MTAAKTAPVGTAGADKASGAAGTGNAVARRGDLVVIHLRPRDWQDGQPREYDDFWLGQVTNVTRAGLVRLYRPAGRFSWEADWRGRPDRGQPLPSLWFERPRPAPGTGRPAAHRRAARRAGRLRHPQAPQRLEHPQALRAAGNRKEEKHMRLRAYLASGEFRVHRDGCRDCEEEAGAATRRATPGNTLPGPRSSPACGRTSSPRTRRCTAAPAAWPAWKPRPSSCPAPAGCPAPARRGTAASLARRTSWPPGRPGSAWTL